MKGEFTNHAVKKVYLFLNLCINPFKKPCKEKGIVTELFPEVYFIRRLPALVILEFSL